MRKGRPAFVAREHIGELNNIRCELLAADVNLTAVQFRDALRRCGIPSNKLFWNTLKGSGLIKEIDGEFNFSKPKNPIHFKVLQSVYSEYYKKYSGYVLKYRAARKLEELKKVEEIDNAIKLLKENGFEILVPIGKLYQKI